MEAAPEELHDELNWSAAEVTEVDGIYTPALAKRDVSATSSTHLIIGKISNNFFKRYAQETDLEPFSTVGSGQRYYPKDRKPWTQLRHIFNQWPPNPPKIHTFWFKLELQNAIL